MDFVLLPTEILIEGEAFLFIFIKDFLVVNEHFPLYPQNNRRYNYFDEVQRKYK